MTSLFDELDEPVAPSAPRLNTNSQAAVDIVREQLKTAGIVNPPESLAHVNGLIDELDATLPGKPFAAEPKPAESFTLPPEVDPNADPPKRGRGRPRKDGSDPKPRVNSETPPAGGLPASPESRFQASEDSVSPPLMADTADEPVPYLPLDISFDGSLSRLKIAAHELGFSVSVQLTPL